MNNNERINQMKNIIDSEYKLRDYIKINQDIEEGIQLLSTDNNNMKQKYIYKINIDYSQYILAMDIGFSIRANILGVQSNRGFNNLDERITQYIRMLILVKSGKLFEELEKVINNDQNVFIGGVLHESEL